MTESFAQEAFRVFEWSSYWGMQVAAAKETVSKISTEEKSLTETLGHIKEARSFEDLTVKPVLEGFCSLS